MLTVKRPGTGIPAADLERIINRLLSRDVKANHILAWSDVGGSEVGDTGGGAA